MQLHRRALEHDSALVKWAGTLQCTSNHWAPQAYNAHVRMYTPEPLLVTARTKGQLTN